MDEQQLQILVQQRTDLMEEYEAVKRQISATNDSIAQLRLERQAQEIEKRIQTLTEKINAIQIVGSPIPRTNGTFPFTNRVDEMRLLLSSFAPAYHLIDAPAGYGKTKLLQQLHDQFKEQNWQVVYLSIGSQDSLVRIAKTIAQQLDIEPLYQIQPPLPPGTRLGSALNRYSGEGNGQGLVFLFDLQPTAGDQILLQLLNVFIPEVYDELSSFEFFASQHNRFRVMIAGRYLARLNLPLTARVLRLSTFSYDTILDSTSRYLSSYNLPEIEQLTSHLFFLTGGHPGCLIEAIQLFSQKPVRPDTPAFLNWFRQEVWEQVVSLYAHDVFYTLNHHGETLEKLSVFRYMDYAILDAFVQKHEINLTAYDLADELTQAYLLDWEGRFLKDDIIRRLLAIKLRYQQPTLFTQYCQDARQFYADQLANSLVQGRDRWIIEYLFHVLYQYAPTIHEPAVRTQLAHQFFETEVPQAFAALVDGHNIPVQQWRNEANVILRLMDRDWEFKFTVNYFLRGHVYNGEPFQQLESSIGQFFSQL